MCIPYVKRAIDTVAIFLCPDLLVQNGSILHIVIDEMSWTHYLGLDDHPVEREHEGVELLDRDDQKPKEKKKQRDRDMVRKKVD